LDIVDLPNEYKTALVGNNNQLIQNIKNYINTLVSNNNEESLFNEEMMKNFIESKEYIKIDYNKLGHSINNANNIDFNDILKDCFNKLFSFSFRNILYDIVNPNNLYEHIEYFMNKYKIIFDTVPNKDRFVRERFRIENYKCLKFFSNTFNKIIMFMLFNDDDDIQNFIDQHSINLSTNNLIYGGGPNQNPTLNVVSRTDRPKKTGLKVSQSTVSKLRERFEGSSKSNPNYLSKLKNIEKKLINIFKKNSSNIKTYDKELKLKNNNKKRIMIKIEEKSIQFNNNIIIEDLDVDLKKNENLNFLSNLYLGFSEDYEPSKVKMNDDSIIYIKKSNKKSNTYTNTNSYSNMNNLNSKNLFSKKEINYYESIVKIKSIISKNNNKKLKINNFKE
jgi:hypothetical protein